MFTTIKNSGCLSRKNYVRLAGLFFILSFFIFCNGAQAAITIKSTHPRIMMHQFDSPIYDTVNARQPNELSKLLGWANQNLSLSSIDMAKEIWSSSKVKKFALAYLITNDAKYGNKAVEIAKEVVKLTSTATKDNAYFESRYRLEGLAYVYDWCNNLLTSADKASIRISIKAYLNLLYLESSFNTSFSNNYVSGHHVEFQNSKLMAGLALYGDDAEAQIWINEVISFTNNLWPIYEYFMKETGDSYMWWNYSISYMKSITTIFHLLEDTTGENWFLKYPWLENYIKFFLYGTKGDGTLFAVGDFWGHTTTTNSQEIITILNSFVDRYDNGFAKGLLDKINQGGNEYLAIIYNKADKAITSVSPSTLPNSQFFNKAGVTVMKNGWGKDDVSVMFKNTPTYFYNHTHRDQNSFIIYNKGEQAIDSGYYDSYGSPHWKNYYTRTIAHNTITVFEPGETFKIQGGSDVNDGGQRTIISQMPYREMPYNVDEIQGSTFAYGETPVYIDNADFTYVVGDASKAYSSTKLTKFKRHFMFFKNTGNIDIGPEIVVFDELKSPIGKEALKKSWLLHTANAPTVTNKIIYSTNGEGALYAQTLLPRNPNYTIIGGAGREFEVQGVNYPLKLGTNQVYSPGAYRVEVSPTENKTDEYFLHYILPTDKTNTNFKSVSLVEGNNAYGLQTENRVIVFNNGTSLPLTYTIKQNTAVKHIILGMAGTTGYDVSGKDNGDKTQLITISAGTQYFSSNQGILMLDNLDAIAPIAADQSLMTNEESALPVTLMASDSQSRSLTYFTVSQPFYGILSGNLPNLTYTPNKNYNGADSLTFKANNGMLDSNIATVYIAVKPVNDLPVVHGQIVTTDEDTVKAIVLNGSDPDGDALTYSMVTLPLKGVLSGIAPNLTYTPNKNYNGTDYFTFKVNDGKSDSNIARIDIIVKPVNDAPILASIGNKSVNEGSLLTFTVSASDVDGNALTYSVTGLPVGATFSNKNFSWTPGYSQSANYSVTFSVSDGSSLTSETVNIAVVDAPMADLILTKVSGPSGVATGTNFSVAADIKNQGIATAGNLYIRYYISHDYSITTSDIPIGVSYISGINPGATVNNSISAKIATTVYAGPFYLGAIIDYGNTVKESNESNNALTGNKIAVTSGVDFIMTAVGGPKSAVRGTTISITNTIKNQGTGVPTNTSYVGLYLSKDSIITMSDVRIGSWPVGRLAAGTVSTTTNNAVIPLTLAAGTYYLGAVGDYVNSVKESNETNNSLAGNLVVVQ